MCTKSYKKRLTVLHTVVKVISTEYFFDQINTENVRQKVWQATFSKSDRI